MKESGPISTPLQELLFRVRQHPAFPELLRLVQAPRSPRYRPSRPDHPDKATADFAYHSGKLDQHEMWLAMLTGRDPARDEEPSQQEKS